jgi:hypothetical protein
MEEKDDELGSEIARAGFDLAKIASAAIPFIGGSIVETVEIIQGRRERRVFLMYRALVDELGDRVSVLEDAKSDSRVAQLIEDAVEAAIDARGDAQVRALGRILAQALQGAEQLDVVEPADVLFAAISSLRGAHVEILKVLATVRNVNGLLLEFPGTQVTTQRVISMELPHIATVLTPLLQDLENRSLAEPAGIDGGSADPGVPTDPRWRITEFGLFVLKELLDAVEDLSEGMESP